MADQKDTASEHNEDGSLNPHYVEPGSEGADDTENKVEKTDEDGAEEKEEAEFDDNISLEKPPEIPLRQHNLQHILARKNEKIEKLESKLKKGDEGYIPPETDEDGEEDIGLTPEAEKAVEEKVQRALKPLLGKLASDADEAEFSALIKAEPEAAKYANHIKAYMAHEAYKGVSPAVIYHHLAFQTAKAIGAKKKVVADKEASLNKGGGRNIPPKGDGSGLPTAQEIADMDDAEFEAMENKVRTGRF